MFSMRPDYILNASGLNEKPFPIVKSTILHFADKVILDYAKM